MPTRTFTVSGMTCEHCASSVTEEISELAGITGVDVSVETGEVTVTSEHELDQASATAAVSEAGYSISSWPGVG
jgi:copper chaperone CopZ